MGRLQHLLVLHVGAALLIATPLQALRFRFTLPGRNAINIHYPVSVAQSSANEDVFEHNPSALNQIIESLQEDTESKVLYFQK